MGKKKSVVLLTLITIVIVVLCAMIVVPAFDIPFTVKTWTPVVGTYDLGAELGGGYYTYYYPQGVISETEYKTECESKEGDADKLEEYRNSYVRHGGLYLSADTDDGVLDENREVTQEFKDAFEAAKKEIASRYEEKKYSSFRVSVVDDYALRVEVPSSDTSAGTTLTYFSYTGEFTLSDGTNTLFEEGKNVVASDYFDGFAAKTSRDSAYIQIDLTSKGRALIKDITTTLSESSGTLYFKVGDQQIIPLTVSSVMDEKTMAISGSYTYETASTVAALLNSAVRAGDLGLTFTVDEVRTSAPVYGEKAQTLLYIALLVILVAAIVLPIVKYRGFGGAMAYSTLSYLIITALCFGFITSSVFEFTLGSVIIFLLGLLTTVLLNAYVYGAIKSEFETGKTVESSVKSGYKKTVWGVVDIYAVLVAASVALLIGAAGLHTMALQALICFISGAFCSLLWTRFINCMMLSASKNKYKYFHFVREDDDDE